MSSHVVMASFLGAMSVAGRVGWANRWKCSGGLDNLISGIAGGSGIIYITLMCFQGCHFVSSYDPHIYGITLPVLGCRNVVLR